MRERERCFERFHWLCLPPNDELRTLVCVRVYIREDEEGGRTAERDREVGGGAREK